MLNSIINKSCVYFINGYCSNGKIKRIFCDFYNPMDCHKTKEVKKKNEKL